MPTPLDFPNSPTVGQQYAAPTGVLYAWDGAVWTAGAATTGLPPTGAAGGDLAGSYPNPTIGPGAVGNAEISDVAYGKVTGAPTIPTTLPPSGAAGGDLSGTYPNPQITAGTIVDADVSATAAIQYTKLTGVPTSLPGPPTGAASGSLAGSYPGPTLTTTGVTAGTYGTTAKIPQVTLTAEGRVSAVTELTVAPTGGSPTGAAGGSLAGSYPNPTLAASAVRGTPSSGGTAREIAKASIWGGDDLIDASVPDAKIAALAYAKLTGAPTALPPSGAAGGDLAGSTYPNPVIAAGAVTWPKLNLQSYARVYRSTAQSIANNTSTVITFDTVDSNVGGLYAVGTPDRFTIQQTGVYLFGGGCGLPNAAGGANRLAYIQIGATVYVEQGGPVGAAVWFALNTLAALSAGAALQLIVYQDSGGALTVPASGGVQPHLWIARVA